MPIRYLLTLESVETVAYQLGATADGQSGTVAVPSTGGVTADFHARWQGATWQDGGNFEYETGNGDISPDDIFFTFTTSLDPDVPGGSGFRVVRTTQTGDQMWQVLQNAQQPPTPGVGQTISWRHFVKLLDQDTDGDYHSFGFGTQALDSSAYGFMIWTMAETSEGSGMWQPNLVVDGMAGVGRYATDINLIWLVPGVWYRMEYNWNRVGTSSWTGNIRCYDENNVLVFDEDDLFDNWGSGSLVLGDQTFTQTQAVQSTLFEFGCPGMGQFVGNPHEAERLAALAAITDDVPHSGMQYGYFTQDV